MLCDHVSMTNFIKLGFRVFDVNGNFYLLWIFEGEIRTNKL